MFCFKSIMVDWFEVFETKFGVKLSHNTIIRPPSILFQGVICSYETIPYRPNIASMERTLLNMDYKFGYALVICDSKNIDEISRNIPKIIKWMKFQTFG